jgi:hypothetical protein
MSKNNRIKAEIAIVQIGYLEIEGLYAPETDQFGVAVPQICSLFQFDKNQGSRTIKALLGNGFQFDKWRSKLHPKAVNVLLLKDVERLIRALDKQGNEFAEELVDLLFGLSLHQLFSNAFNIKFDKEDAQNWLKARCQGKIARRTLTDAIKDWLLAHPEASENKKKFLYSNVTEAINLGIFARRASKLRKDWHCENPRDKMTEKELSVVQSAEGLTMRLIDQDKLEPMAAVHEALNRLIIPVVER